MTRSSRSRSAVATCFTLFAGLAFAEDGSEGRRYRELAESGAAFTSAVGAHRRGDLEAAERGYRTAIVKDSSFVEAMVNLARVHVQRSQLLEASKWLDEAEKRRPEYPGVDAARGLVALKGGNYALAIDELGQARSRRPRDLEVLNNLAAALLMQGNHRDAIEILKEAQRLGPHQSESSFNLGLAYDQKGDSLRAAHHYGRYLGLSDGSDPRRTEVTERIQLLSGKAVDPAAPQIKLHTSSPATSTRTVAKGGMKQ